MHHANKNMYMNMEIYLLLLSEIGIATWTVIPWLNMIGKSRVIYTNGRGLLS